MRRQVYNQNSKKRPLLILRVYLILMLLLPGSFASFSQNVTGNYYGIGNIIKDGNYSQYLTELILVQKGKKITGEFNYYFKSTFIPSRVSGAFNNDTRLLELDIFPLLNYKAVSSNGADCPMRGFFMLTLSKIETILTGHFESVDAYKYTCPSIFIRLKKEEATPDEQGLMDVARSETNKLLQDLASNSIAEPVLPPQEIHHPRAPFKVDSMPEPQTQANYQTTSMRILEEAKTEAKKKNEEALAIEERSSEKKIFSASRKRKSIKAAEVAAKQPDKNTSTDLQKSDQSKKSETLPMQTAVIAVDKSAKQDEPVIIKPAMPGLPKQVAVAYAKPITVPKIKVETVIKKPADETPTQNTSVAPPPVSRELLKTVASEKDRNAVEKPAKAAANLPTEADQLIIKKLLKRSFEESPVIEVDADSLVIALYDNGEVDGDTVALFHNRFLIQGNLGLSNKPINITIPIDTTIHEISMYAENLGTMPPNTAICIIMAGNKRFELVLESNYIRNGTIRFRKKTTAQLEKEKLFLR